MHARKAASVLPEPVGAVISTSSPAAIRGQACCCAGVGAPKRLATQAATRVWNVELMTAARPFSIGEMGRDKNEKVSCPWWPDQDALLLQPDRCQTRSHVEGPPGLASVCGDSFPAAGPNGTGGSGYSRLRPNRVQHRHRRGRRGGGGGGRRGGAGGAGRAGGGRRRD